MQRRLLLLLATFFSFVALPPFAIAQDSNKPLQKVSVAAGGKSQLNFLPLTLAERLGYFKDAGLDVEVHDFQSGVKSVEALIGGSVDLVTGAYEHTLLMQRRGVRMQSLVLLTKSYGAVIALSKEMAKTYKSPADLKGKNIGVSAPGSSMALALEIFLKKNGIRLDEVSVVAIGQSAGAIAAVKFGKVEAISNPDPVVSKLLNDGDIVPLIDTRTEAGMKQLYGGYIAASSITTTPKFVTERPEVAQAFATAIVRTLRWMQSASVDQIMAMVPAEYYGPDKALYQQALETYRPNFSTDGRTTPELATNTLKMLREGPLAQFPAADIQGTYLETFVDRANSINR